MQSVNFSELKRLRQGRQPPRLEERDLEESFVRGSGPGGQSVNKTENCVCTDVTISPHHTQIYFRFKFCTDRADCECRARKRDHLLRTGRLLVAC